MTQKKQGFNRLTAYIILGMLLGIIAGYVYREIFPDASSIAQFSSNMALITDIFLRLIKMIIAPLVLVTLISGIAQMSDGSAVGRVGAKTMIWFTGASLLSLVVGLVTVNILQPGINLGLPLPDVNSETGLVKSGLNARDFIMHTFPSSIIGSMAKNEILAIVVFSLFFGSAAAAIGAPAKPLIELIDIIAKIILKVTGYVMNFAPFAVFASVASVVAKQGLSVLYAYGKFIGEFYLSISLLWVLLIAAGFIVLGSRVFSLMRAVQTPIILAFSTATSESVYPRILEQLEKFGCSKKIASFVLPLGYSFNLDGSTMYCTFATMFIAQAYGIEISILEQISMVLVLMLTSKGIAGVPRASLIVIAATLVQFNIPEAGLLLLFGIDHFLDMGRSATNIVGNTIAAAVVAKWEGELAEPDKAPVGSANVAVTRA